MTNKCCLITAQHRWPVDSSPTLTQRDFVTICCTLGCQRVPPRVPSFPPWECSLSFEELGFSVRDRVRERWLSPGWFTMNRSNGFSNCVWLQRFAKMFQCANTRINMHKMYTKCVYKINSDKILPVCVAFYYHKTNFSNLNLPNFICIALITITVSKG